VKNRSARLLFLAWLAAAACSASPSAGENGASGGVSGNVGGAAAGVPGAMGGSGGTAHAGTATGTPDAASAGVDASAAGSGGSDTAGPAPLSGDAAADLAPSGGPARIVLVAGGGTEGDGIPATQARLAEPFGAVVDPLAGDVYIAEYASNRIRRIDGAGTIHTVVGPGASGPGGSLRLDRPHDLLFQPGTRILFIADTQANRVLRMDAATGEIAPFAGAGTQLAAGLRGAYCLAFDREGTRLHVTNQGGGRIEVIDLRTRAVSSIATPSPRVVTVDSRNNLYVVQTGGEVIKRIDPLGTVISLPGTVDAPKRVAVDAEDNLLIADTEVDRVSRYVAGRGIVLVAGGAPGAGVLGGAPERAGLNRPHGVFEDQMRRMYIADSGNNRVLRIER
jgi:DNA-binding beta-propeller fold protein YncE